MSRILLTGAAGFIGMHVTQRLLDEGHEVFTLDAATKKANELMAHTCGHIHRLPVTELRCFTVVYGPWGRADMAPTLYATAILRGPPIDVFQSWEHAARLHLRGGHRGGDDPGPDAAAAARSVVERRGRWSEIEQRSLQDLQYREQRARGAHGVHRAPRAGDRQEGADDLSAHAEGDVAATFADAADLEAELGFRPKVPIDDGVARFVDWFMEFHGD